MNSNLTVLIISMMGVFCIFLAYWCKTMQAIIDKIAHIQIAVQVTHSDSEPKEALPPEISAEEQKAIDEYNEQQRAIVSSLRNLQSIFLDQEQMTKEVK